MLTALEMGRALIEEYGFKWTINLSEGNDNLFEICVNGKIADYWIRKEIPTFKSRLHLGKPNYGFMSLKKYLLDQGIAV